MGGIALIAVGAGKQIDHFDRAFIVILRNAGCTVAPVVVALDVLPDVVDFVLVGEAVSFVTLTGRSRHHLCRGVYSKKAFEMLKRALSYAAIVAFALTASGAFAQQPMNRHVSTSYDQEEWARPPVDRPGYENLNGCGPGTHGVPAPNGNGFRCVVNGW